MTAMRRLILLAGGGSAALLAGAFAFQAAGYAPCAMCIWQRWPHAAAITLAILALLLVPRAFAVLGALAALTASGLGLYHTGVERDWWQGPSSCSGGGLGGLSGADLLAMDGPALIMCDEVAWAFAGLSMASWNALLSLGLAALWIAAAIRRA
jgi:disulfide bond formation protein DsbB